MLVFVLMAAVLLWRPAGLFGREEHRMSTDELTRAQHVDLPAEPVRFAERPLVRAAMLARRPAWSSSRCPG